MKSVKVLLIFVLFTLLSLVNSNLIYRKYEKKHPRKNYVQVYEIFETRRAPPHYSENESDLNYFLAKDAYKTDMNCSSKVNESGSETSRPPVTRPMTTKLPTINTTTFKWQQRITTTPDLRNLFTIRSTKPTIKPNPRANTNPDYTNLSDSKPNVQVTKHPVTTNGPLILIQELTDDHPTANRTTLTDIDREFSRERTNITTSTTTTESSLDDIIYASSEESALDEEDEFEDEGATEFPEINPDEEDYEEDGDEDDEESRRRKRSRKNKKNRVPSLKTNT